MAYAKDAELVRLNLFLTPAERKAFAHFCGFEGEPKMSMNAAARELFRMAVAGAVKVDRDGANKRSRNAGEAAEPPRKRRG